MIFVNSLIKQIGQECLIFNYKAQEFYKKVEIEDEDFNRLLYILVGREPINLSPIKKRTLLLVVLYNQYNINPTAKTIFDKEFLNNFLPPDDQNGIECLHFVYNMIEFEIKHKVRQDRKQDLVSLAKYFEKFVSFEKRIEDYLLLKYYSGILSFFLGKITETNNYTMDIIVDMNEQFESKKCVKNEFIKYLQIRNSLLRVETLEQEDPIKNRQDIISHLECLLELTKLQKEDFAIKLGLKIYSLQASCVDYDNCIKTLEELLKILHKEMLFGKSHKNLVEQLLYISGLLGYYNSLVGNLNEVKRFSKKIEKSLLFLKSNSNVSSNKSNITISQYDFYNVILQSICKAPINNTLQASIHNYQSSLICSIDKYDEAVLNIHLLNNNDLSTSQLFRDKAKSYYQIFKKKQNIKDSQLFTAYIYVYNYLTFLSQKMTDNLKAQEVYQYAKDIVDYTVYTVNSSQYLKELFQLFYFKELFNRVYYIFIYSFYYQQKYTEAIKECTAYNDLIKIQFELGGNKQSYSNIMKIQGDSYYKLKKYKEALQAYNLVIGGIEDKNEVLFNMGLCYILLNDFSRAIQMLNSVKDSFGNKAEKRAIVQNILSKIERK